MLETISAEIIYCRERARLAREKADTATTAETKKNDHLAAEARWLALARGYEQQDRLSQLQVPVAQGQLLTLESGDREFRTFDKSQHLAGIGRRTPDARLVSVSGVSHFSAKYCAIWWWRPLTWATAACGSSTTG